MLKKVFTLTALCLAFASASSAYAAGTLGVRLEIPKSPTNQYNFKLNFVALDINGNPVTVKCYKKSPVDTDFVQFDTDKSLKAGGNSGYCTVDGIMSAAGVYQFKTVATSDITVESNIVSVDFRNVNPDTPNSYSKEKKDDCNYTIRFRTANDSGRTVRVALYRSDNTSFSADSGTQVESRDIGSDQAVEITNRIPVCGNTYYYSVRAFDVAGNGSGVIGDENITYTSTSSNSGSESKLPQAIALLGGSSVSKPSTGSSEVTISPTQTQVNTTTSPSVLGSKSDKNPFWKSSLFQFGAVVGAIGLVLIFRKKK